MKILVSDEATAFVNARGGRLFVWLEARRCCTGGFTFLGASTDRPSRLRRGTPDDFVTVGDRPVEVLLARGPLALPDELHIELRGWPRRQVRAFWNGCAVLSDAGVVHRG